MRRRALEHGDVGLASWLPRRLDDGIARHGNGHPRANPLRLDGVISCANEALRLLSSRLERPTIKARHLSIPAVFVERASARVADSDPTMQRQATARDMAAKHGSDVP